MYSQKKDVDRDVTASLKDHPLKPTSAGVESAILAFPKNIQLLELEPTALNWEGGEVSSIDGYIIVRRTARLGGGE